MARRVLPFMLVTGLSVALSGCGFFAKPQRPAWRDQAENACLAQKLVKASAYVQPASTIDGPGICGLEHPFHAQTLAGDTVALNASQTLGCPMIASLDAWVTDVVQPAATARFGMPVVKINSMGSYSCRSIDNLRGAKLSEHAFGNATDIGGFVLQDGREINVMRGWKGQDEQVRAFLREVQAGACSIFTTVLAPGSDSFHYNHIHLDLAMHGNTSTGPRRICKPLPTPQLLPPPARRDDLPDPPVIDEELDVSQNGLPRSTMAMHSLDLGAPPAPIPSTSMRMSQRRLPGLAPPTDLSPPRRPVAAAAPPRSAHATIRDDGAYDPGESDD